jgi:ABC-type glycerol-3-phosphate transport system substrate-binding protein
MQRAAPFRVPRRVLTRTTLVGAAAVASGVSGLLTPSAARAQGSGGKVRLLLQVSWQGGVNYVGTVQALTQAFLDEHWVRRHPGVEVTTQAGSGSNANAVSSTATIAAVLAGDGPDIVVGCCSDIPSYEAAGILEPLDPYIRRDNVNMQYFPPSVMDSLTTEQGVMGFPDYGSQGPLYMNKTLLDALGVPYPSPDWTYEDAVRIWRAVSGVRKGQRVYGINWHHHASGTQWIVRGWGGAPYDPTHTKCLLDSPECVAAYEWYASTFLENIATIDLGLVGAIQNGQAAFSMACCGTLQSAVLTLGNSIDWDLVPVPTYPKGKTTYNGSGIYGMNALTKNPKDLVWDLLKFVCLDPSWQRFFNARLAFLPPNSTDPGLWEDWMAIARRVAPLLREKNLEAWLAVLPGSWSRAYFRYAPLNANAIWQKYADMIIHGQIGAAGGLAQAAHQINALEQAAARAALLEAGVLSEVRAELAAANRGPVTFSPPARTGVGLAPQVAPPGAVVVRHGAYVVSGGGSMANGGTNDDGVFACAVATASQATFTCRLTAVAEPGRVPPGGGKVGLMARGDLSDNAPMVFLALDLGGHGLHLYDRPLPGLSWDHQKDDNAGLSLGSTVLVSSKTPVANWISRPLWLRLVRSGGVWTAFVSLDGQTWKQAGQPVTGVQLAGAWVGLAVSSNDNGHLLQATFDDVSGFVPDTFVALGGAP